MSRQKNASSPEAGQRRAPDRGLGGRRAAMRQQTQSFTWEEQGKMSANAVIHLGRTGEDQQKAKAPALAAERKASPAR